MKEVQRSRKKRGDIIIMEERGYRRVVDSEGTTVQWTPALHPALRKRLGV